MIRSIMKKEKVDPPTDENEKDVENEFSIDESSLDHGLVPRNTRWRETFFEYTHTIMGDYYDAWSIP